MNDAGDLVRDVQAAPLLAGRLAQLEDHGERRHAAEAALGLGGPEAHGRKGAFDGIGGANVLPVLGREVVEGEQHVAVLGQAGHRFVVLGAIGLEEEVEGLLGHRLAVYFNPLSDSVYWKCAPIAGISRFQQPRGFGLAREFDLS